jgi:uncharacterized protein YkwD
MGIPMEGDMGIPVEGDMGIPVEGEEEVVKESIYKTAYKEYAAKSKEIMKCLNQTRKNPKMFNVQMRKMVESGHREYPKKVLEEAIGYLTKHKGNLHALKFNKALENAAVDHLKDICEKGIRSHNGSDGSNYRVRIERYALWGGCIYETILYHQDDV